MCLIVCTIACLFVIRRNYRPIGIQWLTYLKSVTLIWRMLTLGGIWEKQSCGGLYGWFNKMATFRQFDAALSIVYTKPPSPTCYTSPEACCWSAKYHKTSSGPVFGRLSTSCKVFNNNFFWKWPHLCWGCPCFHAMRTYNSAWWSRRPCIRISLTRRHAYV
jgi:hypothetical protein